MSVAPNSPFPFAIWPNNDLKKSRKPTPASRVGSYVVNGTRRYRDDPPTRFESTSSLTPRLVTKETHTADGHPFDEEDHLLDMEHESDQAEHAQSLPREERERRYGDARYTARTRSPVEARDDLPRQSSMRRTKKAYDPKRHASQEDAERAVKDAHDKWLASGGADPRPKKPKADKPAKPDWKVQGQQRILQSPRSEPRQDNSSASLRRRNSPDAMEKGIGDVMSRAANYLKQKVSGTPKVNAPLDRAKERGRPEKEAGTHQFGVGDTADWSLPEGTDPVTRDPRARSVQTATGDVPKQPRGRVRDYAIDPKTDQERTYAQDLALHEKLENERTANGGWGARTKRPEINPMLATKWDSTPVPIEGAKQTNDPRADFITNLRSTRIRNDQLRGSARGEQGDIDSPVRLRTSGGERSTTYPAGSSTRGSYAAGRGRSGGGARSGMAPALGVGEDINEPKNMMNRSMRRGTMRKSVPMGYSFDNPMPIPFHDDGLPNWDGVPHGCFASLPMDNGPLKGKVVVLHRLQNGMYIISPDGKLSNPQNRDKDKGKLRKERPEVATDDNYGTEMAEKSLRRMRKGFSEKLRDEFLILAGYKSNQLRKADERRPLNPRAAEKVRWASDGSYRLEPLPSDDPETAIRNHNEAVVGNHKLAGGTIETLDRSKLKALPKSKPSKPEGAVKRPSRPQLSGDERRQAQDDAWGFRMEMGVPVRRRVVKKAAPEPGKERWTNRQGRPTLRGQSRRVRGPSGYVDTGIKNNGLPGPSQSWEEKIADIHRQNDIDDRRAQKKEDTIKPYVEAMGYNPNDVYKHMEGTHHVERVALERQHADVPTAIVQPKRDALALKHQNIKRELIARIRKDHAKAIGQEPMPKELRPIAGLTRLHPEQFKSGNDFFSRPEDIPWDVPRNVPKAYIPDSDKRAE